MTYEAVHNAIRKFFDDAIDALPSPPPVVYDNAPDSGKTVGVEYWLRFQVLPGESEVRETGGAPARTLGFALVSIFVEPKKGDKVGLAAADVAVGLFKQASTTYGGVTVGFHTPEVRNLGLVGDWWQINVQTPFWTDDA